VLQLVFGINHSSVLTYFSINWKYVKVEVFKVVTIKNAVFWNVTPCGSCENDVSEERIVSIVGVKRI
jgi:hypothetical protein